MEQIISALLISIPCAITFALGFFEFYFLFSKRISKESFFKTRKKLAIIRVFFDILAIVVALLFKFNSIAIVLALISLNIIGIDSVFYFLEKYYC